jgi:hypothetical protein
MLLMLVFSLAAPSSLVQGIAWVSMFSSNIQDHSLSDSISRTFVTDNPCTLCRAADSMKKEEGKSRDQSGKRDQDIKKISSNESTGIPDSPEPVEIHLTHCAFSLCCHAGTVPVPPPRA